MLDSKRLFNRKMEGEIKVNLLLNDELEYELRIRGVTAARKDQSQKRKILRRLLESDVHRNVDVTSYRDPGYVFEDEQARIDTKLHNLRELIAEIEGPDDDAIRRRVLTRLAHLSNRIKRITIPAAQEDGHRERAEYKDHALSTSIEVEADLFEKLENINANNVTTVANAQASLLNASVAPPFTQNQSKHFQNKSYPVYKWNVKFSGGSQNVHSFLEIVSDLSKSRGVSEDELFSSAVELFSGTALTWYRSVSDQVSDWPSLVNLLERDYLPDGFDDLLWEEIKVRTQGRDESIHEYVAVMKRLFNRLARPPHATTILKYVRRNLLPRYLDKLTLVTVDSLDHLVTLCREIDTDIGIRKKYNPPSSSSKLLGPELAYVAASSPLVEKRVASLDSGKLNSEVAGSRNRPNVPFNRKADSRKSGDCWNCGGENHTYQHCTKARGRFCYRCGAPNVTVSSCGNCKNKSEKKSKN